MTERPIFFNAADVRAILAGSKTQTRRAVKLKPWYKIEERDDGTPWPWMYDAERDADHWVPCPYGKPGDRLWVRETWAVPHRYDGHGPSNIPVLGVRTHYAAAEERGGLRWRPSIHMPRWASRITLGVEAVRVERLQDISFDDAIAEGVADYRPLIASECQDGETADQCARRLKWSQRQYQLLWESINGPRSWDANPWVWAISFRRITP